ncbi:UvrD-helicase domain-containing protein [Methylobacterium sp. E-046]|uniref:UvrD-helicase domain-containing protein n=1 Tax=Methylobacterium sp. E-046 TaxID=2836576 RepID=UPI001FB8BB71|nr:UvrD-helicase domain-containing protein [Methylobacterium sp. E-046]MCJ2102373.1 UvrD-helicase domain-containing protein [Methylobacterium sp. E-046]
MDPWRDIRLKARRRHAEACEVATARTAEALVKAALKIAKLQVSRFAPGTRYAVGVLGALDRSGGFVRLASNLDAHQRVIVSAHEIGHFWLHDETAFMVRSTVSGFGGRPVETGADRVVAYSPRQRMEVQADIFAQEFLLPSELLHEMMVAQRKRPEDIAAELGLPVDFVRMQAIRALLLPPLAPPPERSPGPRATLPPDPQQLEAARWDERPLILDAGPGTGKTRTLIARIEFLLATDVPPSAILALTFSNKAAAEMIERIEMLDPVAAPIIWVGTFHAFGLELLHLYHREAGLPQAFEVLDEIGALAMLERLLPTLGLRHFQNLWDPTLELRPILRAISRAKDEMVTAEAYGLAAAASLDAASTPEERERAEKAMEVARVYRAYQAELERSHAVDFGDLVWTAARLLAENPKVREAVREKHRFVLVDEYQDVNNASTALLEQISDGGLRVWVVADPRQSIYRFRGAAPANAAEFTERYPDAERRQLKTNYRSCETVVRVFETYGAGIAAAPLPAVSWKAHRGKVGFVDHVTAPDLYSEAHAVRDQIERLREQGIPYDEQAILSRTHLCLARFSRILQELGVPVLYLGDVFERPEIRDLLALVSLGADPAGAGLIRVARFPEYGATRDDALLVIAAAHAAEEDVITTCGRAADLPGLSERGRRGLGLLAEHLAGTAWKTTAWKLLSSYLFDASDYLRPLLEANDVRSRQSLIAIYQLLKFCREHHDANDGRGGRRVLLNEIRRLERLDDDRQFRVVPPEADGISAVRVMTIHGSKGLEFRAVHLPQVATRYVPGQRRPTTCPAPASLERLQTPPEDHAAEEECLFFVALSRARDVMTVSNAKRYTEKQTCNPSRYLGTIGGVLPPARLAPARSPSVGVATLAPPEPRAEYEFRHLETYMKCPARYRYEHVDGLGHLAERSGYLRFHGCVRQTVAWICEGVAKGDVVTPEAAVAHLTEIWPKRGPTDHPFEAIYRTEATRMVERSATAIDAREVTLDNAWTVTLAGRRIALRPDRVLQTPSGTIVAQRFKTGRKTKAEAEKPVWELLQAAGRQGFSGRDVRLEAFYPAAGEREVIAPKGDGKGLDRFVRALEGIEAGEFKPIPARECPDCQFYFICTSQDFL